MPKILDKSIVEYIRKWAGKKTTYEMANDLEVSFGTITNQAYKYNISLRIIEKEERARMISEAVKEHHENMTVLEIAKALGVPKQTLRYHARMQGVEFKRVYPERENTAAFEGEFFNEGSRTNWLI